MDVKKPKQSPTRPKQTWQVYVWQTQRRKPPGFQKRNRPASPGRKVSRSREKQGRIPRLLTTHKLDVNHRANFSF